MIRTAHPDDIPRITQIRAAVRENRLSDPSKVTHADVLAYVTADRLIVDQRGETITGFCAWAPDGLIWALFVDPAHEARGIGTALLAHALRALRQAGQRCAHLTTDPGTRAEAFYLRRGWSRGGLTRDGEIRFTLNLSPAPDQDAG